MSLLLVDGPDSMRWSGVANELVDRLIAAEDQVRVLLRESGDAGVVEGLREDGVHVAFGDASNGDLLERAAQGCRTIVLFDPAGELVDKALEAARFAHVERLIVCARSARASPSLSDGGQSYVWLKGRPKGVLRPGLGWADYAAAIDAADDLAGDVKLDLDLEEDEAWAELGLTRPGKPRGSSRPS